MPMPTVRRRPRHIYALCVNNVGAPASLEVRKLYRVLPDALARSRGFLRVIDESGEDYLYPADWFMNIALTPPVRRALAATA